LAQICIFVQAGKKTSRVDSLLFTDQFTVNITTWCSTAFQASQRHTHPKHTYRMYLHFSHFGTVGWVKEKLRPLAADRSRNTDRPSPPCLFSRSCNNLGLTTFQYPRLLCSILFAPLGVLVSCCCLDVFGVFEIVYTRYF